MLETNIQKNITLYLYWLVVDVQTETDSLMESILWFVGGIYINIFLVKVFWEEKYKGLTIIHYSWYCVKFDTIKYCNASIKLNHK